MAGFGAFQVLRFGFNLVLTRLLLPEVFGLMALVDLFLIGLHMLSDVGVGPWIVQSQRGDDARVLRCAWTLKVVRGVLLSLGAWALAVPVAAFYEIPLLASLLPVAGLNALLYGLNSVAVHTCERNLDQRRLVLLNLVTYLASTACVLGWLFWVERSVWGLVAGRLVGSVLEMVGSHWYLPGPRCRLAWDGAVVAELMRYGKWIVVSTACTFLADQADRLILGKMTTLDTLGKYNLAVQLTLAATMIVSTITSRVVFPLTSRRFQRGEDLGTIFASVHLRAGLFAALLTAGLIGTGPAFIRCLFKPAYHAAGWMLQWVAVAGGVTMLQTISGSLLWVVGNTRGHAAGNALKLLALPPCAWLGYRLGGLEGLLAGFVTAEALRYAATVWALRGLKLPVLRTDLGLAAGVALAWCASAAAGNVLPADGPPWPRFGAQFAAVVLFWLAVLAAISFRRPVARDLVPES